MYRVPIFVLVLIFTLALPVQSQASTIPIIVDIDGDVSDFGALIYLLLDPTVDVLGITISAGITRIDDGVDNTLRLLDYLDLPDIPVAGGPEDPLEGSNAFPAAWREGVANFFGTDLPATQRTASSLNASELMHDIISTSSSKVTIVAVGPLTNVAELLLHHPSTSNIAGLQIMGGALRVEGNVGISSDYDNTVAEWNFFIDPKANDIVLSSDIPLNIIPLDATNDVPTTEQFANKLDRIKQTPAAELYSQLYVTELSFWDELAAVSLVHPDIVEYESHYLAALTGDPATEGGIEIVDSGTIVANIAVAADADAFEEAFLTVLNDGVTQRSLLEFPGGLASLALVATYIGTRYIRRR